MDVIDILEGAGASCAQESRSGTEESRKKRPREKKPPRPAGMAREVYELMLDGLTPVSLTSPTPSTTRVNPFRERRQPQGPSGWIWDSFTPPGHEPGALVLRHWVRRREVGSKYPYAAHNVRVEVADGLSDGAEAALRPLLDEGWTLADLRHLFVLAGRFHVNFVHIHDRWEPPSKKDRALEDLADAFYRAQSLLVAANAHGDAKDATSLAEYRYPTEYEKRRRVQWNLLQSRNSAELAEEEMLLRDLKKMETRPANASSSVSAAATAISEKGGALPEDIHDLEKFMARLSPSCQPYTLVAPPRVAMRVAAALDELGVPAPPPLSPNSLGPWNELRKMLLLYIDLQKTAARRRYEADMLEFQLEKVRQVKLSQQKL